MALQLGALRDALKEAGASEQMARQAAEEVAAHENRLTGIEQRITELRADIDLRFAELRAYVDQRITELRAHVDQRFTAVEGRLNLLTWMVGNVRSRSGGAHGSAAVVSLRAGRVIAFTVGPTVRFTALEE